MSIYEMTIKTENVNGLVRVQRTTCYGEDAVAAERAHYRSLASTGGTQTIEVRALTR